MNLVIVNHDNDKTVHKHVKGIVFNGTELRFTKGSKNVSYTSNIFQFRSFAVEEDK